MQWAELFCRDSNKTVGQLVSSLKEAGERRGFMIHNEDKMQMAKTFGSHGVQVADGFDLHMIQFCKPQKAANSLQKNPERAALMPKFVMVFSQDGVTKIRFLRYNRPMLEALVDDEEFSSSVAATYSEIATVIEEAI